jgi:hypothetical protein
MFAAACLRISRVGSRQGILASCSPVCRYHAKQMVQQRHRLAARQWHARCHVRRNDAERCLVHGGVNTGAEQCLQSEVRHSGRPDINRLPFSCRQMHSQ